MTGRRPAAPLVPRLALPGQLTRPAACRSSAFALGACLASLCGLMAACGGSDEVPTAPALTITSSAAGATNGPVTFTFTFSEDVGNSFTNSDVVISAGSKSAFSKLSATQYALVVNPPANAVGSLSLSVAADAYSTAARLSGASASSLSQAYDTLPPTLTIASSAAGTVAKSAVTVTFNFSEDVGSTFSADDVQVTFSQGNGGAKGSLTRTSATQATLVINLPTGAAGNIDLNVAVGAFSDSVGNASVSSFFGSQQYDTR